MSEVDPDPYEPAEGQGESEMGGRDVPATGDPTAGGKRGKVGDAPSISADEPDETSGGYPAGGGSVDPGPDA